MFGNVRWWWNFFLVSWEVLENWFCWFDIKFKGVYVCRRLVSFEDYGGVF